MQTHVFHMVAGLVLQKSYLNEVWVLLFMAALAAFIIPSLNRRVRLASHRVAFWSAVGVLVVGSVIVSCVSIQLYQDLCREGHVIEWLSALMLLMAGLVGVAAMIRLSQQRRPSPMTLFLALNEIRDTQAPSLQFDFVCRAGICGSCGMLINGRPGLA